MSSSAYSDDVPAVLGAQGSRVKHVARYNLNAYYSVMWFEAALIAFFVLTAISALLLIAARAAWCRWAERIWSRMLDTGRFTPSGDQAHPRPSNWPRLILSDLYSLAVIGLVLTCAVIMVAHVSAWKAC